MAEHVARLPPQSALTADAGARDSRKSWIAGIGLELEEGSTLCCLKWCHCCWHRFHGNHPAVQAVVVQVALVARYAR